MLSNKELGIKSENLACSFIKNLGFEIIDRNFRCKLGEIDIIAKKNNILVFIEVKYRTNSYFGGIMYSIDNKKLIKIKNSINYYLQKNPYNGEIRVDAILIENKKSPIHIENIM